MKWLSALLLTLVSSAAFAQKGTPNAVDFPLTIHVLYSRAVPSGQLAGSAYSTYQEFETVINGQRVELIYPSAGVLALGDYPARAFTHPTTSHPNSYDVYQGYDLLMPDGKVRSYTVVGLGPAN